MNKKQVLEFWKQTENTYNKVDMLRIVHADNIHNLDRSTHGDLLSKLKEVLEKCLEAEVVVSTEKIVTFIVTVDDRIFDL